MEEGKEYLLFLKNEIDDLFVIRGINFGKVALESDTLEIYKKALFQMMKC